MIRNHLILLIFVFCLACSCRREQVTQPEQGLTLVPLSSEAWPAWEEDPSDPLLRAALSRNLTWLQENQKRLTLLDGTIDSSELAVSLRALEDFLQQNPNPGAFKDYLQAHFDLYELHKNGEPGVHLTGYYGPVYKGSLKAGPRYPWPLYKKPKDLLSLKPSDFPEGFLKAGEHLRGDRVPVRYDQNRGRIVPYHSRQAIDQERVLAGKGLEIVYLSDYFDQFLFHVQGGGFVALEEGGFLQVNYADKNGRPYRSVGRLLVDDGKIPKDSLTLDAVHQWFAQHPEELFDYCFRNESYVFYQTNGTIYPNITPDMYPNGVLGFPVTAGRSIALDKKFFGGALPALLVSETHGTRLVFDQDTGGAIKENRVDLFVGIGEMGEKEAGAINDETVQLLFLVPKKTPVAKSPVDGDRKS